MTDTKPPRKNNIAIRNEDDSRRNISEVEQRQRDAILWREREAREAKRQERKSTKTALYVMAGAVFVASQGSSYFILAAWNMLKRAIVFVLYGGHQ